MNREKLIHTAYVGGPIDLAKDEVVLHRKTAINRLKDSGITVYDPASAFSYGGDGEITMKSINDFALANVNVVLLIFERDVVTIGTPIELQNARNANRLILVVSPWKQTPCYIKALADHVFDNVTSACDYIIEEVNKCK